jgi:hypothetical protein
MSKTSLSLSGKGAATQLEHLEHVVTKEEEAGVGDPLHESTTSGTVNEVIRVPNWVFQ